MIADRVAAVAVLTGFTFLESRTVLGQNAPSEAPPLEQPSLAATLTSELEREAAALRAAAPAPDEELAVSREASINIRLLAADLLAAGDRAGSQGTTLILAGLKLAHGRTVLGAAFGEAASDEARRSALIHFNAAFQARQQTNVGWQPESLDESMSSLLQPLTCALLDPPCTDLASHWIAAPMHSRLADRPPPDDGGLEQLASTVSEAQLPEHLREDLAGIIDFLERGEQFVELRPRIARYRRVVLDIVQLERRLREAAWLGDQTRRLFVERLTHAVSLFKTPESRDRAIAHTDRLSAMGSMIEQLTALDRSGFDVRAIAQRLERECEERLAQGDPGEASPPLPVFAETGTVLQRMLDFRALPEFNARRELRSIDQELQRAYRSAEENLLKALVDSDGSGGGSGVGSDPSHVSLLAAQKELLIELQRLRRTPGWFRSIASINHEAPDGFIKELVNRFSGLLEPSRRPDAQAALDQIERQVESFAALPFEDRLKAADSAAITASGGLHEQLSGIIEQQRRLWAVALSDGDLDGPHTRRLALLRRLTQAMADSAELIDQADRLTLLNRWSAWELESEFLKRPASELISRLKLATAAIVAEEDAAASEQLDRIESETTVVLLAGRLADLLAEDLGVLPDGAPGILGQLSSLPDAHSFMADRRGDLASLCRYVAELEYARAAGRGEGTRALAAYVNELALRLLRQVNGDSVIR